MSILDDIKDTIGVRDLFSLYKGINQVKIDNKFAETQNTIAELNAAVERNRLGNGVTGQNNTAKANPFAASDSKKMLGYALLAAAGLAAGYLLLKK